MLNFRFNEKTGEIEIDSDAPSKKTPFQKFITFIKELKGLLIPAAGYIIERYKTIIPVIPKGIVEYVFPFTIILSAIIIWHKISASTKKLESILEKIEGLERGLSKQPVDDDTTEED